MIHNIILRSLKKENNSYTFVGRSEQIQYVANLITRQVLTYSEEPIETISKAWLSCSSICLSGQELIIQTRNLFERAHPDDFEKTVLIREFGQTKAESSRYSSIVFALRLSIVNLESPGETTLRDIYYRDVAAFGGSQENSNMALRRICKSFNLSLANDLRILPSPKGVIWGGPEITLNFSSNVELRLNYDNELSMISNFNNLDSISSSKKVDAVVIFEKEASLRSFCDYIKQTNLSVILISGKGFPDHATKIATASIGRELPHTPFLGFFDSDVYGLRIFWNYFNAYSSSTQVQNFFLAGAFLLEHNHEFLTIAKREWKLSMTFLKDVNASGLIQSASANLKVLRRELTRGMLLAKKAEINAIWNPMIANDSNEYLLRKIMLLLNR